MTRETIWVACGPSRSVTVPVVPQPPSVVKPARVAHIGRQSDPGWAPNVSRRHGELVATADGRLWFRDVSSSGTFLPRAGQLAPGEWRDVTDIELCLGSALPDDDRVLRFKAQSGRGTGAALRRKPAARAVVPEEPVAASSVVSTQRVHRGDIIPNPAWEKVPERLTDVGDDLSSGFILHIHHHQVVLPLNGRPVPFGSDPGLGRQGGVTVTSPGVSGIHGFYRFNAGGGAPRADGSREGCIEVYDGNGKGRPSTNHIFCQSPGQPIGYAITPGSFRPITLDDTITFASETAVVTRTP